MHGAFAVNVSISSTISNRTDANHSRLNIVAHFIQFMSSSKGLVEIT